jgi:NAD(P)-dependent dehydrogenase (short-subunit alcohol dehydrogenase family)
VQGHTALVAGSSRIGKEIACELTRNGDRVAVSYLDDPAPIVDATKAEIRAFDLDARCIKADIRAQVAKIFEKAIATFGRPTFS